MEPPPSEGVIPEDLQEPPGFEKEPGPEDIGLSEESPVRRRQPMPAPGEAGVGALPPEVAAGFARQTPGMVPETDEVFQQPEKPPPLGGHSANGHGEVEIVRIAEQILSKLEELMQKIDQLAQVLMHNRGATYQEP
jgi:hypothetical protein